MAVKKGSDVEAVVTDPAHVQALMLAVAYAEAIGATNIKARLDGYTPPNIIPGVFEPHRPDLAFTQPNLLKTGMIVDIVLNPRELNRNRAILLNSAARHFSSDLGFFISKDVVDGEPNLRYRLASMGITPQKVWAI